MGRHTYNSESQGNSSSEGSISNGWDTQERSTNTSETLSDFSSSHETSPPISLQQLAEDDLTHSYQSASRPASQEFGTPSPVPLTLQPRMYFNSPPPVPSIPDRKLADSSEAQSARSEEARRPSQDSTLFYSALEPTPGSSKRGTPESASSKDFHLPTEFRAKHIEWVKKPKEEKQAWAKSLQKPDTSLPQDFVSKLERWDAIKKEKDWADREEERESKQSKENGDKKKCCIVM